ncbi:hypothetical protein Bca101_034926 [Brassica carinata]
MTTGSSGFQVNRSGDLVLMLGGGNNPYDMTCMEPIVLLASTKVETLAQGTSEANDETFGPPDDVQPTSSTDQLESNTHEIMALYLTATVLDKISIKTQTSHVSKRGWVSISSREKEKSKDLPLLGDLGWVMSFLVLENGWLLSDGKDIREKSEAMNPEICDVF